ncbi:MULTISPECIES: hypothetical protein [Acinetobacter]|jgi:hypothetical protein|uniref:Uncharacterized protein n=5 Tax=Acinetobacter bereziniae TaxID=106648 RepID=A0A8I1DJB4_ACIBZ|nr:MULTISPECIES: hypothetical protein [Acinetobacter]MEC8125417.1 hypothetical protein [Pseudomonadota bacterium]ATZ63642.1 hypothetical protein BSR55_09900 [Acinetobacter bereziniae]ELW85889.1 hypothetical protein ACINWC743_2325 [Acinetobacter sp. WC-743]ENV21546.1 hypothetical protein F963_02362 [Acinetobacter bereziniae NIPH 3]ENW00964.1 hypothetical protein F938_00480 [Acinetobacter bereziniae LMG 1003 = CIP 70.12]
MNESQQKQGHSRLLLNIVMIILETIYSFVLKHDRVVRLQAKKFVEQQMTIKINSYIPYFDFYIQFTDRGILFDLQAPEKPVDLSVSSTLIDLIQIFVFANRRSMKKMRLEGSDMVKDQFRDLVIHLTAPKLLSDWKQWLTHPDDDSQTRASKKRIAPLLEKIDQQRSKINTLQVEVKQYQNRVRRLQQNQQRLYTALGVIGFLFVALIMYNLWQIFM